MELEQKSFSSKFKLYWILFKSTLLISLFTFGGGYVMVTLMQRKFVEEYKWIDGDEMLDIVAIATSCPGPIAVNASILIGFRMAKVPGAIVTVIGTIIPPMLVVGVISIIYTKIKDLAAVALVLRGMRIGVAAVMVDVVVGMLHTLIKSKTILGIIIFATAFIAQAFFNVNVILIIVCAAAIGALTMLDDRKKSAKKTESKTGEVTEDDLIRSTQKPESKTSEVIEDDSRRYALESEKKTGEKFKNDEIIKLQSVNIDEKLIENPKKEDE